MAEEIERKFLVSSDDYRQAASTNIHIVQGYLCRVPERTVRVRLKEDRGFLTIKGKSTEDGVSRFEWEKEISSSDAQQLIKLCQKGTIDKIRYLVDFGGHCFEVDEFHADNEGLVIAELELKSADEPYEKPSWLGKEVTSDPRFYNSWISDHPWKGWSEDVNKN